MIKIKITALVIACIAVFNSQLAFSQKKAELIETKWSESPKQADGLLNDWQDSLTLYNEATKLFYGLANDDKNIYLALKSTSKENLTKILARGISFSANIEDKKKTPPTVIFPVLDRTPGKPRNIKEQPEEQDMQKQVLARIKDIKVTGFKEIIDGGISLQNTYGIRAAAAFDKNNNLVQEVIIPLSLLNLNISDVEQIVYNIKINGLQSPSMGQRPGGMGSPMGGGRYGYGGFPPRYSSQVNKLMSPTDFYIKSKLASKP